MDLKCRTCLAFTKTTDIDLKKETEMLAKIELLIGIQIAIHGKYPSSICAMCIGKINDFVNFRCMVLETDMKIHQYIRTKSFYKNRKLPKTHEIISNQKEHLGNKRIRTKSSDKIVRNYYCSDCDSEFSRKKYFLIHKKLHLSCKNENSLEPDIILKEELMYSNSAIDDTSDEVLEDNIENNLISTEHNDANNITQDGKLLEERCLDEVVLKTDHDKKMSQILLSKNILENRIQEDIKAQVVEQNLKATCERKYKCQDCDEAFFQKRECVNHRKSVHLRRICSVCGNSVRSDHMAKHMRIHQDDPIACNICNKILKNQLSLRTHINLHKGLKYECDICKRIFKVKTEFQRHLKLHKDPSLRKYPCKICGKSVRELRKHMLTHTGERPYLCKFCEKGFTSPYALKVHVRQHTNEKPYVCEYCSMGFPQKVSLVTHLKSKHGKKV